MDIVFKITGATLRKFIVCTAFIILLVGPIGSGKTSACVFKLLRVMSGQKPGPDGVRRTRFVVIRNTRPELISTTIKAVMGLLPPGIAKLNMGSPITLHIKTADIDSEWIFLALDHPDDVRKLLSLEVTAGWINEAREIDLAVINTVTGRLGRYPAMRDGGPTWYGLLMDSNPGDQESDLYRLAEVDRPSNMDVFYQPSGLSPEAENIENLPPRYYPNYCIGKSDEDINVYVHGRWGFVLQGRPVYGSAYRDGFHCKPVDSEPTLKLVGGLDGGLTPALAIGQALPNGQIAILDELCADGAPGLLRFASAINAHLSREFPGYKMVAWYDPALDARSQSDGRPMIDMIKDRTPNIEWHPAPSNDFPVRREAVLLSLNRNVDGEPGLVISPKCATIRKGFNGKYHFPTIRGAGGDRISDSPVKNVYSHIADGLQYLVLGCGGYSDLYALPRRERKRGPFIVDGVGENADDPFNSDNPPRGNEPQREPPRRYPGNPEAEREYREIHGNQPRRRSGLARDMGGGDEF